MDDLDDKLFGLISEIRESGISSLDQLDAFFANIDAHFEENPEQQEWHGHHKFTIMKAKNRFQGLPSKFGGLLSRQMVEYGSLPKVDEAFDDGEAARGRYRGLQYERPGDDRQFGRFPRCGRWPRKRNSASTS